MAQIVDCERRVAELKLRRAEEKVIDAQVMNADQKVVLVERYGLSDSEEVK